MKEVNYFDKIIKILKELKKEYPQYNIGRHLSTSTIDYGDIWGMTDKELLYAINKYKTELSFDIIHEEDIEIILKDGMELDKGDFIEEDEEDF